MRGDGGVAGEGRIPKFHLWGKCTLPLTSINSDWMSSASSGLCIILYYVGPLSCILWDNIPQYNLLCKQYTSTNLLVMCNEPNFELAVLL